MICSRLSCQSPFISSTWHKQHHWD
jgi:hypothetical protein